MKRLVVIESPFAGDVFSNNLYALDCLSDSLERGEAPIASHLLYPQVLNDDIPEERKLGIDVGHAWMRVAEMVAVYDDFGITPGMQEGIKWARTLGIPISFRKIRGTKT